MSDTPPTPPVRVMRMALVIPMEVGSVGVGVISAHLRRHGHETKLIYLPNLLDHEDRFLDQHPDQVFPCSERLKDALLELVRGCDLVGFHVLSAHYHATIQFSEHIRKNLGTPIIWGGVHPSMAPETCLPHADWVGIGDGEELLLDLLNRMAEGRAFHDLPGLAYLREGTMVRNPCRPAIRDLDALPFPDFSLQDHYCIDATPGQERTIPITADNYRTLLKQVPGSDGAAQLTPYRTTTSRGCPFRCTYCSIGSQDKDEFPFRSRTPENVIQELESVLAQRGDLVDIFMFTDDTFLSRREAWIQDFCELYQQRINRPFRILVYPANVTHERMEQLYQAGCARVSMGLETLSKRILFDVYDRKTKPEKVIESANILVDVARRYQRMPPGLDLIHSNPFETMEDVLDTVRGVNRIHRPFEITLFHMTLFPGSKLHRMAVEGELISANNDHLWVRYTSQSKQYALAYLLYQTMGQGDTPASLIALLSHDLVFPWLNALCNRSFLARKFIERVILDYRGFFSGRYLMTRFLRRSRN